MAQACPPVNCRMKCSPWTPDNFATLEHYCTCVGQVRKLEKIVQQGFLYKTEKGWRVNPVMKLQENAMNRARLLAAELGLTPVSRSRPAIRDDGDDDADSPLAL